MPSACPRCFDRYIVVDWSAASKPAPAQPRPDTIWSAELARDDRCPDTRYHRTRAAAAAHLLSRLRASVRARERVLIGFDFPLGYPRGFAAHLGPEATATEDLPPWRRTWQVICEIVTDDAENCSNRFDAARRLNARVGGSQSGPFWGCPSREASAQLHAVSPGFPYRTGRGISLQRLRRCEMRLSGTQEPWKLFYTGSVGSQALTGIPRVHGLRFHAALQGCSRVWPFETGFTATPTPPTGPAVVHAEMWPTLAKARAQALLRSPPPEAGTRPLVRDQAQVWALCEWARELDTDGAMAERFAAPAGLDPDAIDDCVAEEGWVLGAP
jgi:hypothetical protein